MWESAAASFAYVVNNLTTQRVKCRISVYQTYQGVTHIQTRKMVDEDYHSPCCYIHHIINTHHFKLSTHNHIAWPAISLLQELLVTIWSKIRVVLHNAFKEHHNSISNISFMFISIAPLRTTFTTQIWCICFPSEWSIIYDNYLLSSKHFPLTDSHHPWCKGNMWVRSVGRWWVGTQRKSSRCSKSIKRLMLSRCHDMCHYLNIMFTLCCTLYTWLWLW